MNRLGQGGTPTPGRVLTALLRRRLNERQRAQLLGELAELHEHRRETMGREVADRWLRREHRRLVRSLLFSSTLAGPGGDTVPGSHPSRWRAGGLDVRQALRGLRRTPGFTLAMVLIVGLGIGGTTLVYSVVHAVLVSPLPYPGSERMVLLRTVNGADMWGTSMADLEAVYDAPPAFDFVAGYSYGSAAVTHPDGVELLRAKWVTDNYFTTLGIAPISGRSFTASEGRAGGPNSVVLSESYAVQMFSGAQRALGNAVVIDGEPHTVVGVIRDATGPLEKGIDVFPVLRVETPPRKGPFFYPTIARLREGVDPSVARAQLAAVSERIFPQWQESFTLENAVIGFVDLKEILVGDVARTLVIVMAGVAFLLLIACANAASLLIARGVTRAREVSVRAALGASRMDLFRMLLLEAGGLALAGAALAWGFVWAGMHAVRRFGAGSLPRVDEITTSAPVVGFFVAVTVASWALFGLIAASSVLRAGHSTRVASAARSTASPSARLLRRTLVGLQFSIAIPLLIGAGLLVASLNRLETESLGFDPEGLVSMQVSLPAESYPDEQAVREFWSSMLPEIVALPGVLAAGLADARPPVEYGGENNFELDDRPAGPGTSVQTAPWITADAGFFSTYGIRLVEGRVFNDLSTDTMRAAVVDEAWAERFYPASSPVGHRFRSGGCTIDGCPWTEIVGVVATVKATGLADRRRMGTIYYDFGRDSYSRMSLHLRSGGPPLNEASVVRRLIATRDATIPVADIRTVEDLSAESLQGRRYTSLLVSLLALIALVLSVIGVYGAMSYFVRQHRRDIGIRLALGAAPAGAMRLVVGQGMRVATGGTVVGIIAAIGLTRYMNTLLYDVSARDPLVFIPVGVVTLVVALAATVIPGRAAAGTDPAIALREE